MAPLRHVLRIRFQGYLVTAIAAFMLGSATIVLAAVSGAVKIDSFHLADGTNPDQLAKVDTSGNVAVSVANTPSVSVANSPSVTLSGTPTVKVARQPFQQFVSALHVGAFGEDCATVTIPDGMRLTIESFTADAEGATAPQVYLLTVVQNCCGGSLVRNVILDLRPRGSGLWTGEIQTLLFS